MVFLVFKNYFFYRTNSIVEEDKKRERLQNGSETHEDSKENIEVTNNERIQVDQKDISNDKEKNVLITKTIEDRISKNIR